jgi:hypothetical protein
LFILSARLLAAFSHETINLLANLLAALSTVSAAAPIGFSHSLLFSGSIHHSLAGFIKDFTHHCCTKDVLCSCCLSHIHAA